MLEPELVALLNEVRLHLEATEALFATLPERQRTAHLARRARELAGRCEGAVRANTYGEELI